MKEGIKLAGKKQVAVIIACIALMLILGVTTAFAATGGDLGTLFKMENGNASYSADGGNTWTEGTPEDSELMHSLDDGETWHEGLPPEGSGEKSLITNGGIPDGSGDSFAVRNIDGIQEYSTDGGKTWSETAPDGMTVNENGSVSFTIDR